MIRNIKKMCNITPKNVHINLVLRIFRKIYAYFFDILYHFKCKLYKLFILGYIIIPFKKTTFFIGIYIRIINWCDYK